MAEEYFNMTVNNEYKHNPGAKNKPDGLHSTDYVSCSLYSSRISCYQNLIFYCCFLFFDDEYSRQRST